MTSQRWRRYLWTLPRIIEPTEGHAEPYERVVALLEIGNGALALTGRTYAYLNDLTPPGTVMVLRKVMDLGC